MRVTVVPLVAAAVLAGVAPAWGSPTAEVPTLAARLVACATGPGAGERAADFKASMPAAEDSSVLQMRFELQQRSKSAWKALYAPAFGRWERSETDAAGFVYEKRIERLAAGSAYRVRVEFRWEAADGEVLKRATRWSQGCTQPEAGAKAVSGRPPAAAATMLRP